MTTASTSYVASAALTVTLASLANDGNLIAGRQSAVLDNTTENAVDYSIGGKITTGTSPTNAKQIEVWAAGSYDGTTFAAGAGAGDGNFSPTGEKTLMERVVTIPTDGTSNHTYEWCCSSLARVLGAIPKKVAFFFVHNTGVALNATAGNHELKYTPIHYTSA